MENTIQENQHTCKAVVLHCIDFRFQQVLNGHFDKEFPEGYDLVSVAGGVKELVDKGDTNDFLLEQVKISCKLHHPQNIVLIQHEDCGAYGGSGAFKSSNDELAFQKEQLEKAAQLLKHHFPEINIQKYFVTLSKELMPL